MTTRDPMQGVCGLDCAACGAYRAWRDDDQSLREQTAQEWSVQFGTPFAPEDINCSGCRTSGVKGGYTDACPLRGCAIRRGEPTCGDCGDFGDCAARREFEAQSGLDMGALFAPKARP